MGWGRTFPAWKERKYSKHSKQNKKVNEEIRVASHFQRHFAQGGFSQTGICLTSKTHGERTKYEESSTEELWIHGHCCGASMLRVN